jgi:shikimate kinase
MSAGSSSFSLPTLDFLSPDSYNGVELIREKFVSLMPKRKKIIYLTGFMGSGKSTVGALLARELGWLFIDLDQTIEAGQGMTIRKIFETEGEPRFRWLEHAALRESVQNEPAVIALGGGTIVQRHNQALLREMGGTTIWLSCSPERLLARCAGMEERPSGFPAPRRDCWPAVPVWRTVRFSEVWRVFCNCYRKESPSIKKRSSGSRPTRFVLGRW